MKAVEIQNLDQHLKPLQVGGVSTGLELSTESLRISSGELSLKNLTAATAKVDGDLTVDGNINMTGSGNTSIIMANDIELRATDTADYLTVIGKALWLNSSAGYADTDSAIYITADDGYDAQVTFMEAAGTNWSIGNDGSASTNTFAISSAGNLNTPQLKVDSDGLVTATGDIVAGDDIAVAATGRLSLDGIGGHTYIEESSDDLLRFTVGGTALMGLTEAVTNKVSITDANLEIDSGKYFFLDGGGDTMLYEHSADHVRLQVGGDDLLRFTEIGDDGNTVHFYDSSVGFTQLEPTYNASATNVDFRFSNKQNLTFGAGNITNVNLIFPAMSGNFQLLLKQDGTGSRTVTNWKALESDESAADGSAATVWAGGSAPTLTTDANHVDILSFYWDADNEIAYGVATLDFQF